MAKKIPNGRERSKNSRKRAALRKKFRRNQQPRTPRRKQWIPDNLDVADLDEWTGDEYEGFERIMPLDEGDRRRSLEQALANGGTGRDPAFPPAEPSGAASNRQREGVVTTYVGAAYEVAVGDSRLQCTVRGVLDAQEDGYTNVAAVGDRVLVLPDETGGGVIEEVLPRRNLLARPDVFKSHLRQIVAANLDRVLIVASWREPAIWFELIDRYLIAASRSGLPTIICVNKIDLAEDRRECEDAMAPYRALGIPYIYTSVVDGEGMEDLRSEIAGKTSVLAGLSGVGKSSLLTALHPELALRVGEVSARKHEGKHTTRQATLIRLDDATNVVDTPGIRQFGLAGLTRQELGAYFPDLAEWAAKCRFRNCLHLDDQGCAVRSALSSGKLAASRYHSYCRIHESLA